MRITRVRPLRGARDARCIVARTVTPCCDRVVVLT